MDLEASPSVLVSWAVVLAVYAVGSLSTCATAAPLILQLDTTSLLGHRLVVAIEPLLEGVTTSTTEADTTAIILNTTAGAINGSYIYFNSNSVNAAATLDDPEIVAADVTTTEAGLPPTSTATAVLSDSLIAASSRSEKSHHITEEDYTTTPHISEYSVQPELESMPKKHMDIDKIPGIRTRIRDDEYVDNFLISFPNRCPPGWRLEHGQCRRPFNHVNDLARPRSKAKPKRKIKMMA